MRVRAAVANKAVCTVNGNAYFLLQNHVHLFYFSFKSKRSCFNFINESNFNQNKSSDAFSLFTLTLWSQVSFLHCGLAVTRHSK